MPRRSLLALVLALSFLSSLCAWAEDDNAAAPAERPRAGRGGAGGLEATLAVLDAAGIDAVGGERIAVARAAGKSVAVAGFSYSLRTRYVLPLLDIDAARETVADLKRGHDLVVVSFHGGAEGAGALRVADAEEEVMGEQRGNVVRFARAAGDAGAGLGVGRGPAGPPLAERAPTVRRGSVPDVVLLEEEALGADVPLHVVGRLEAVDRDLFFPGRGVDEPGVPAVDPPAGRGLRVG